MFKKYLTKKKAKNFASLMAKREAQIALTAIATMGTQRLLQKAAKKYPALRFLKDKNVA